MASGFSSSTGSIEYLGIKGLQWFGEIPEDIREYSLIKP
jgi:hypothetical protein